MNEKPKTRSEQKREAIIEAAKRGFREHGVQGTSMDALAEGLLSYRPVPITELIGEKGEEQQERTHGTSVEGEGDAGVHSAPCGS